MENLSRPKESGLYLIRHSEPEYLNLFQEPKTLEEIIEIFEQGTTENTGITEKGVGIAEGVAKELQEKEIKPDLIVVSPFKRTGDTAMVFAQEIQKNTGLEIPVEEMESLSELTPDKESIMQAFKETRNERKDSEKVSAEEVRPFFRRVLSIWIERQPDAIRQKAEEAIKNLEKLSEKHNSSNILIISHGMMLTAVKFVLEQRPLEDIVKMPPYEYCTGYSFCFLNNEKN